MRMNQSHIGTKKKSSLEANES